MSLSFVIPTLNSARGLEACLRSIGKEETNGREIIVVDGGSHDDTIRIASTLASKVIRGKFKRSSARRVGVESSSGDWLFFLDSDQILERGTIDECLSLTSSSDVDAIRVPERDSAWGFWSGCRRLDRKLCAVDAIWYPRMVSRRAYLEAGGFALGLEDFMEDRDFLLRLDRSGVRFGKSESGVINLIGHLNPVEIGRKMGRAAGDSAIYYARNKPGGDTLGKVIVPRLRALTRGDWLSWKDLPYALALPVYVTIAYGPRFLVALQGELHPANLDSPQPGSSS